MIANAIPFETGLQIYCVFFFLIDMMRLLYVLILLLLIKVAFYIYWLKFAIDTQYTI